MVESVDEFRAGYPGCPRAGPHRELVPKAARRGLAHARARRGTRAASRRSRRRNRRAPRSGRAARCGPDRRRRCVSRPPACRAGRSRTPSIASRGQSESPSFSSVRRRTRHPSRRHCRRNSSPLRYVAMQRNVSGTGFVYCTAHDDERWRSARDVHHCHVGHRIRHRLRAGDRRSAADGDALADLDALSSSAERLTMPVTSTKWPSSFLTSFMRSPLPARRKDFARTIGPLWVSVCRGVGDRQDAALEAARDHELDRIVRDLGPFLTSLLVRWRRPTSSASTSVFMMFSEGQAYLDDTMRVEVLEVTEGTEVRRFTNGERRERRRNGEDLRARAARSAAAWCVRTTDANTRGASGARVCRPDAPTRADLRSAPEPVVRVRPLYSPFRLR